MSDVNDTLVALNAPVLVTGANNQTYLISQMTPRDFAEHGAYLKTLCDAETRSPLAAVSDDLKLIPAEFQAEAIRAAVAMKAGGKISASKEAIWAKSQELIGIRHSFWLAARKNHSGLTLEQVSAIVTDANVFDVSAAMGEVNGRPSGDDDPKAAGQHG